MSVSYSLQLRDAFLAKAERLPYFTGFTIRKTRFFPIQKEDLPALGVYLIDETMTPDGDGNAGEIDFIHTARIGFSVIIVNNDPVIAEQVLDNAFMALMNGLWRNPYLTSFIDTYDPSTITASPGNVRFESIARGLRSVKFGTAGQNNETPVAELQYDVSVTFRAEYAPTIEDDLLEVDITTAYPPGLTDAEHDEIQQVRQVIKFTTTTP